MGGCFCGGEGGLSCEGAAFAGGGVGGTLAAGTNGHVAGGPGGPRTTTPGTTLSSGKGGGGGGGAADELADVGFRTVGAGGGGIRAESSVRIVGAQATTPFGVAVTAV